MSMVVIAAAIFLIGCRCYRASQHGRQFLVPAIALGHGALHVPNILRLCRQSKFVTNLPLQIAAGTGALPAADRSRSLSDDEAREFSVQ